MSPPPSRSTRRTCTATAPSTGPSAAGRTCPDPRDDQLLPALGGGGAAAGRLLPGDRPGPDRARRRGDAAGRLLAGGPRGEHPRPADDDRGRAGDDRRPLARRRRRDAVLLPVPPAHRAPGADLQRRPRPRRQPAAARRRAARLGGAAAAGDAAAAWSALAAAGAGCASAATRNGVYLQAVARALGPLQDPARAAPSCRPCAR